MSIWMTGVIPGLTVFDVIGAGCASPKFGMVCESLAPLSFSESGNNCTGELDCTSPIRSSLRSSQHSGTSWLAFERSASEQPLARSPCLLLDWTPLPWFGKGGESVAVDFPGAEALSGFRHDGKSWALDPFSSTCPFSSLTRRTCDTGWSITVRFDRPSSRLPRTG